jgi:hypothetical protein
VVTVVGSTAFLLALMMMRAKNGGNRRHLVPRHFLPHDPAGVLRRLLIALGGALLPAGERGLGPPTGSSSGRHTPLVFMRITHRSRGVHHFAVPLGVFAGLARRGRPPPPRRLRWSDMTPRALAWRTITASPARAVLAVAGVTSIGRSSSTCSSLARTSARSVKPESAGLT